MKLILPKKYVNVGPDSFYAKTPTFFLAGPVLGAGDWQRRMMSLIDKRMEQSLVVCPCRYDESDVLHKEHAFVSGKSAEVVFEHQTNWERYYLEHASRKGCIIFWLGCESKLSPRNDGKPYSCDTLGEIGEWRGHLMHNPNLHVVVGAEHDFPGLSVIKTNFLAALGVNFPIYSNMEATVVAAIQKSYNLA